VVIAIKIVVIASEADHTAFLDRKLLVVLVADLKLRVMTFLCPLLELVSTFSLWIRFCARWHPVHEVIKICQHLDPC